MIHHISDILNHNFHGVKVCMIDDVGSQDASVSKASCKVKVYSSGTETNYGKLLKKINTILPEIYDIVDSEDLATISNSNRKEILCWYIDTIFKFTLKENLPKTSFYAIRNSDYRRSASKDRSLDSSKGANALAASPLWISKPSHQYIGSGKYIEIGTKASVMKREDQYYKKEKIKWVIQPLLTNIILWYDKYKFDIRTYGVIFNVGDTFYGGCSRIGVGRRSVHLHDPVKDPMSAITNISLQHTIKGYDTEFTMPMIYDDRKITVNILEDLMIRSKLTRDPRKKTQVLILGFDILFLDDGTPKLIEVNEGSHLEIDDRVTNNEKIASEAFILGLFGYIVPKLLKGKNTRRLTDWDFC